MTYRDKLEQIRAESQEKQEAYKVVSQEIANFKSASEVPRELNRYRDSLFHQFSVTTKKYNDLMHHITIHNIMLDAECKYE